jgi:hypothetical protein
VTVTAPADSRRDASLSTNPPALTPAPAQLLGAATLGLTLGVLLLARARPRPPARAREAARLAPPSRTEPQARQLYQASAMLAASVLSDSALEHYRGQFENPGMFTPLASAALVLSSALRGARRPRVEARGKRADLVYGAACAVGLAGLGFHTYNLLRRPGGLSWGNLFYAAPVGAPAALSLAGLLGLAARRVEAGAPTLAGLPSGQALCALSAFGLAGNTAEVSLLHFRGAFQHPAMWVPVSVPPVGAALLLAAAVRPQAARRGQGRLARTVLAACTWLGLIGMGFHARGVARQMGGWSNWSQNLLSGPPLPAPPSFSALALAGRAALSLRMREAA